MLMNVEQLREKLLEKGKKIILRGHRRNLPHKEGSKKETPPNLSGQLKTSFFHKNLPKTVKVQNYLIL